MLDYASICRQTVTLYNVYKVGTTNQYHKTVFNNDAYLEDKRISQENRAGLTATNKLLFVVPEITKNAQYISFDEFDKLSDKTGYFTVRANDRAIHGIGDDITTPQQWGDFISSKKSGIVTISDKSELRDLDGNIVHIEAGGN